MSLLRLLTTGKSLVGLKDQQSRYVSRGGLPRFGGKQNPFRATTRPEFGLQSEANRPVPAEDTKPARTQPNTDPSPQLVTAALLVQAAVPVLSEEPQVGAAAASASPVKASCQAPLGTSGSQKPAFFDWRRLMFWKSTRSQSRVIPRFGKPLVQGELSLDGVKVVRNDLSETDLEIVPAQPAAEKTPATASNPFSKELAAETTWSRVTGRFFGAGKV
jgi:hypothetical protein